MKRRLVGFAVLGAALFLTTTTAYGFGGKRRGDCGTTTAGCGSPCAAPCGTVSYVEKKVMVNEWTTVKEEFKYWVNEPEKKKEKVKVKEAAWKDENFKYTTNEWVTVKEKVKVGECKATTKEVEVSVWECKPVVTKAKRTVCEWVCVPVTVTCAAPAPSCNTGCDRGGLFSRLCGKKASCGTPSCNSGCASPCPAPCPQVTTKTVMQRQMITKEIEVDVTTYTRIEKKVKTPVTTYEMVWTDKEVDVKKCMPVEKTGTHKVCHWVDVEKEVDVVTYKKVEKTGTHDVRKCVQVEKTVKVAVYTPAPVVANPCPTPCTTPCASPCTSGTTGGCGAFKGGLFKGGLFKGKSGCTSGCGGCN